MPNKKQNLPKDENGMPSPGSWMSTLEAKDFAGKLQYKSEKQLKSLFNKCAKRAKDKKTPAAESVIENCKMKLIENERVYRKIGGRPG